mmetsp:Transcript_5184/g.5314  ORF Transcript_5184/g.5314 Transcript_5184/m.5314 type:complete len:682 (-) Transcript_5184:138-2183(-)
MRRAATFLFHNRKPLDRCSSMRIYRLGSSQLKISSPTSPIPHMNIRYMSTNDPEPKKYEFQAETRKLLDIVTHSIYTDKEVFLRELISNASDALEKKRYLQITGSETAKSLSDSKPLEINIMTDVENRTLTISDSGIGMTQEELISNLGTIARSGSKQFVEQLKDTASNRDGDGIIGQFGVGFYSAFMVAKEVSVQSRSASEPSEEGFLWRSDGSGDYTVTPVTDAITGSSITIQLKDDCDEYCDPSRIKEIIKRYSNFVSFPIKVDGNIVNTISAIWLQDKKTVTETQYKDFYKFISNAWDEPRFTLHFSVDAPIDLKALFFFPSFHGEKFGMGRIEPGVNLYSRKVLIETKPKDLLPEWLRFLKGVVDSEDLPLSLSREKSQDSRLLARIKDVLSRKVIRFLEEQQKNHPDKYRDFYQEYSFFLKEGICQDFKFQDQLGKLLMFESSGKEEGDLVSLDDYISRLPPESKSIYYLIAPTRSAALQSPYFETFRRSGTEVLLLYNMIDDFVMTNLKTYGGRSLVSAETSSVDIDAAKTEDEEEDKDKEQEKLSEGEVTELCEWLKTSLGKERVREVKSTTRLSDSPAIVTDHESGALRRMMRAVEQASPGKFHTLPPQVLEINPSHTIMRSLFLTRSSNPQVAALVAEQLLDNALIAAGVVDDARSMLPRLNELLVATLSK